MTDSIISVLSGGNDKYERLSKRGFRLVDHFEITLYCHHDVSSPGGEYCETKNLFVLEKEKGVEKPTPYVLIYPSGSERGPVSTWLTDQVKQKLTEGFFPTKLVFQQGVLVEQTEEKDERFTAKQDLRVVSGSAFWAAFIRSRKSMSWRNTDTDWLCSMIESP